jgi:hypothetical protein
MSWPIKDSIRSVILIVLRFVNQQEALMFSVRMRAVLFFTGAFLLPTPKLFGADAPLKKLRVGYPSHSASMYPIYVTKEANLFEKYGLDGDSSMSRACRWCRYTSLVLGCDHDFRLVTLQSSVSG